MNKPIDPIPSFENEAEERAFWERTDSTLHFDWSKAHSVRLLNLKKRSTASVPGNEPHTCS